MEPLQNEPIENQSTEAKADTVPEKDVASQPVKANVPFDGKMAAIFLGILALILAGLCGYLYMSNGKHVKEVADLKSLMAKMQPKDIPTTIIGPVTNGIYKVDERSFVIVDLNNNTWVVNYQAARFIDASSTMTLDDWLQTQSVITGAKHVKDVPGRVTIEGVLKYGQGVVHADVIRITPQ